MREFIDSLAKPPFIYVMDDSYIQWVYMGGDHHHTPLTQPLFS